MQVPAHRHVLDAQLAALLEAVPGTQQGDMGSVHAARVASRRLRETLPVAGASASPGALRKARREVRRVTRALGPVRELDVAIEHLEEFAGRGAGTARATTYLCEALQRDRQARRADMLTALTPSRLSKLRKRVEHLSTAADDPEPTQALSAVTQRIAVRAQTLIDRIEHAGSLYLPDRLHAVRIATKKLRYALEVDRDLRKSRATTRIRQLKSLQDKLGRLHDLEILIDQARGAQLTATADRELGRELDQLIAALERETRKQHASYMSRRDAVLRLCEVLLDPPTRRRSAAA